MSNDVKFTFGGMEINFTKILEESEHLITNVTPEIVQIVAGVWTDIEDSIDLGKETIKTAKIAYNAADDVLTRLEEDFDLIKQDVNDIDKDIKKDIKFVEDNYILISVAAGVLAIIHIIIFWACQRLSFSVYFGWFLTLTTGGLGFFYLVYKATIYDEDEGMEKMIKNDRYNFVNDNKYDYDLN
jgi:hypothetical protein